MNFSPFNPTLECHKSITKASAAGTSLRLRVVLPRNFGVTACFLVLSEDNKSDTYIPMTWESTDGVTEWWYTDFCPERPALFFYRFAYNSAWGHTPIGRAAKDIAGEIGSLQKWQLTVFDRDFKTPDWVKGAIIYQIFPDRFCCSGEKKENVPEDRILHTDFASLPCYKPDENGIIRNNDFFGGDFKGIESKLDYIKSLGVSLIYLNPICEAHSNHRYDTADYLSPDSLLGTKEDFISLCNEAHKRDIKIILDGVFSHTGADSIYFNKFNRYATTGAYQSEGSEYYSWYTFKSYPDKYNSWWGIDILPEVNENSPSFTEFITGENGVIDYWLSLGADGFRLDVADELPDEFLDNIRIAVKRNGADKFLLGEVWEDASNKISGGGRRRFLLGKQLDSVMNYPFRDALIDFLLTGSAESFMDKITEICRNYPPEALHTMMNHLGTHDTERILTVLSGINCEGKNRDWQAQVQIPQTNLQRGIKLLKMALSIIYTLPGVPSIYYGDEAGLTGCKDPFNRRFYPWGRENTEILDFQRFMGNFRCNSKAFTTGEFIPLSATLGCVAYMRYLEGEKRIAAIANKNPKEITYWLNWDMKEMQVVTGGEKINGGVIIPAETCVILTD